MYEVVWDTTPFNNKADWPADGSQPFVFSYGDSTGYGQHADYVFGWKGDSLQIGMDATNCMGAKCKTMKNQDIAAAKKCAVKTRVQEPLDQCKSCDSLLWSFRKLTLVKGSTSFLVWKCKTSAS
jgi:hypothetical protein